MLFSFQIQYARKTKVDDLMTPKKFKFWKSLFFKNQTILTLSIFHMYDVPINLPVYQPHSRWYYHRAVKLPGGVGHLSKNALMFLDFSKNWHREVKFCRGFKNLGLDIWNRTHDPQFENCEIFTLWLIVVNVVKLKCRDQIFWIRDKILLPGANL